MRPILFQNHEIQMSHRGGPPGKASVGRAISTDISDSMGAGVAEFDQCSIDWQVSYDEIVHVLEGVFRLVVDDEVFEAKVGDTVWIPKGTQLTYQGDKARIFYVVYPGNWRELRS